MFTSSVITIAALASTSLAAPQFGYGLGSLLGLGNTGYNYGAGFGNSYGNYGNSYGYGPNAVTYCEDVNYQGRCRSRNVPTGQCVNVDADMNDLTSSMRIPFGLRCELYVDYNCQGGDFPIQAPGLSDFRNYDINDAMSSFRCYQS